MWKVMIVDDEIIVRVGFKSCVNWEEHGCEVIAACDSTESAIASIQQEVPDIVFTDIMMPGANGIELVKYLRSNYPKVRVVVLSCVEEIEYVKQAIRLGAEDYILKLSFTKEMMTEVIRKICDSLNQEEEAKDPENEEPDSNVRGMTGEREEAFRTLLEGDPSAAGEILERLGYDTKSAGGYEVGCFLIDGAMTEKNLSGSDRHLFRSGLVNMIREYFGRLQLRDAVFIEENEILLLLESREGAAELKQPEALLEDLNDALRIHFNLTLSLGMHRERLESIEIPAGYRKAQKAVQLRFFDGRASYHETSEPEKTTKGERSQENDLLNPWKMPEQIQEAVFAQNTERAFELVQQWFDEMKMKRGAEQIPAIRRLIVGAWIMLSGYGLNAQELPMPEEQEEMCSTAEFWKAETLEEMQNAFQNGMERVLKYLNSNRSDNREIAWLIRYLKEHVNENISLDQAAGWCALGKSQFCVLFKKQTGDTFLNYFNRLKMKHAYALLKRENMQVQEVAERVGIHDVSYFSRLFKRYYSISPSELKRT